MTARKYFISAFLLLSALFISQSPVFAIDWIKDLDAGLDEACERGVPAFIFLCQTT